MIYSEHTIESLQKEAAQHGLSQQDTSWLLCSLLQKNRAELILDPKATVPTKSADKFRGWTRQVLAGQPLQYVVGQAPFWDFELSVDSNVLIPRPETEMLVELTLSEMRAWDARGRTRNVVDVGTGSGVIAIALKREQDDWNVGASDLSELALDVARKNAADLNAEIEFRLGDLLGPWSTNEQYLPIVVANLPYVDRDRDEVAKNVKDWEPDLALYADEDQGAGIAHRLLNECSHYKSGVGVTVLELSPTVAYNLERKWSSSPRVSKIFRADDLAGRSRFLFVRWKDIDG